MGGRVLCATSDPLKICLALARLQVSAELQFACAQQGLGRILRVPLCEATASPVGYGMTFLQSLYSYHVSM